MYTYFKPILDPQRLTQPITQKYLIFKPKSLQIILAGLYSPSSCGIYDLQRKEFYGELERKTFSGEQMEEKKSRQEEWNERKLIKKVLTQINSA